MSRNWVISFSLLIGVPLFIYILVSVDMSEGLRVLQYARTTPLILYLATSLLQLIGYALAWNLLLLPLPIRIAPFRIFNYRMTDYAISYVTPGPRIGGELTRTSVALPHGDHDDLLLSSVVEKICIFITGFAFDLTAVLVAIAVFPVPDLIRYTLYVLLLMVIILFYIYHRAIIHDKSFVASCIWFLEHFDIASVKHYEQRLTDFEDNLKRYFTEHSPTLYTAMTVCLLSKALIAFQVYFLLAVLNIPGTLLHAVFLAAALDIAYAIPSYMGVGMLEAGQVSLFKLLKLPESIGVLVALVTRLRDLLFSGYGLLMIYIYGKN